MPPRIDGSRIRPDLNVIENNSIVLNCPATGVPEPEISWLKDGQAIVFEAESQYDLQVKEIEWRLFQAQSLCCYKTNKNTKARLF